MSAVARRTADQLVPCRNPCVPLLIALPERTSYVSALRNEERLPLSNGLVAQQIGHRSTGPEIIHANPRLPSSTHRGVRRTAEQQVHVSDPGAPLLIALPEHTSHMS